MAEDDHVLIDRARRGRLGVDRADAVGERQRGVGADRAARRQAHVADDDVGAGPGHVLRVLLAEDVGRGEQVEGTGPRHQLDLEAVAHAGFLEIGAEGAVDEADGGKVLDPGKAQADEALQEGGR
jgi:hypothetical protein